ncbi:unnamed protein product, partial [Oncorhynchus mykiss]
DVIFTCATLHPKPCVKVLIPSCRCIDILELSERLDLLKFHFHTLMLYCAVCALGNNRVAHALCSHVDESQLFYAMENTYLPGPLRSGFYDLLISIHLESAKRARLGTNREFIVPMSAETLSITLYPDAEKASDLPGVGLTTCLRPKLHFSTINFVGTDPDLYTLSPVFPLQVSHLNSDQINVLFINPAHFLCGFGTCNKTHDVQTMPESGVCTDICSNRCRSKPVVVTDISEGATFC